MLQRPHLAVRAVLETSAFGPPFPISRCNTDDSLESRAPAAHVSRYQSFRFPRSPPSQALMLARRFLEMAETRGR